MLTLLSPGALGSLAALALPLAIHLWRHPPRTVRLGSLRFLQGQPRRWRQVRWREPALLAVRLALLAVLTALLARPVWRRPPIQRPQRWALLDPAATLGGPALARWRALQAQGDEARVLADGFPAAGATLGHDGPQGLDLWSRLREADARLPAGSALAVFSAGQLADLRGVRPALAHCRVEWVETPLTGETRGSPADDTKATKDLAVRVWYDSVREQDARFIAAACQAVAQTGGRTAEVRTGSTDKANTPDTADWTFWLSAKPVPAALEEHARHLFSDLAGREVPEVVSTWIVPLAGGWPGPTVALWRRGVVPEGATYWSDGFGRALLTRSKTAHGEHWRFASRFAPGWNDLPLNGALAAALRPLLAPNRESTMPDSRRFDARQGEPSERPARFPITLRPIDADTDLRPLCWVLLAGLFGAERLLVYRSNVGRTMAGTGDHPGTKVSFVYAPSSRGTG